MFAYARGYGKLSVMGEIISQDIFSTRLQLVPMATEHVEAMHEMSVDPEVRRYLWAGKVIPVSEVELMVAASQACFTQHSTGLFVMFVNSESDRNNGEFVGFCGHRLFEDGQQMELLFGMRPAFWGRGFGQEAARTVLHHGFAECRLSNVLAATDTPNQRSVQVLQRLGMSFKERREWHGLDTVFYEISAAEYAAGH